MPQSQLDDCLQQLTLADLHIERQCELLVDLINEGRPTRDAAHELQTLFELRNSLRAQLAALRRDDTIRSGRR